MTILNEVVTGMKIRATLLGASDSDKLATTEWLKASGLIPTQASQYLSPEKIFEIQCHTTPPELAYFSQAD